jgi:cytochrome c
MARLSNAAAFVKANMPLGQGAALTDADAIVLRASPLTIQRTSRSIG